MPSAIWRARGCSVLLALAADAAPSTPIMHAARIQSAAPRIDGRLDEAVWDEAAVVATFLQRDPVYRARASEATEVRVLFDDERLYIAFRCLDSAPADIVASHMRRDADLHDDDNVSVILDTYNDGRGGYYFSTNALGAQRDGLLSNEGRSRNEAWDCVWACKAQRDSTVHQEVLAQ